MKLEEPRSLEGEVAGPGGGEMTGARREDGLVERERHCTGDGKNGLEMTVRNTKDTHCLLVLRCLRRLLRGACSSP